MPPVQTYVFFDLETTGLPKEELNKTRIIELSLVAVKRHHLLDTRPGATPRVQHKLTLCLNPRRLVSDGCSIVTGLDNDLLEDEPVFDHKFFSMIDTFLSVLSQPVCLIAQNGLSFDFPILKNHLVKLKVNFTADLLCADCLHSFYDVLEKMKVERLNCTLKEPDTNKTQEDTSRNGLTPTSLSSTAVEQPLDDVDFSSSNISMQVINETTPKTTKHSNTPKHCVKAKRRLFFWGDGSKPKESYKLKDIYERVLNKPAKDAHRAENDCMLALEISSAIAKQFVEWVDLNHMKFSDIVPMTIGVPMK